MTRKKIIIFAEPVQSLSAELNQFLTGEGFMIIRVKTLKEMLLTIQKQSVDVLVLDAALLEKDCEFISIIKGIEKDLPVIICSGANTPELESKIRKQSIFYYHIKSFGIQDLEMAISNAVNGLHH